ncbi:protein of unknown function DUF2439 [Dillenia turbinata]|uniref:5'-3' DNA helicase ZGRF1-like N-terminal domain-containing protein n=1 Tax=Dillenia turbinata TaxID=194707 RepID=A0AAN8WAB2_9MAGN
MESTQKWSMTYTKHIKQKRKVYQDGFLYFYRSTNKVKIYDEREELLEIRILKNDEIIRSGETIQFNTYLVDIGDPEGDHKPVPYSRNLVSDNKKADVKNSSLQRQEFVENSISEGRKNDRWRSKAPTFTSIPSPSQKLIREFKKSKVQSYGLQHSSPDSTKSKSREFKKSKVQSYGLQQNSPDSTKSESREWQVLYTTQVTQKTKKYHDGFLKLAICGSRGRQVMLYDTSWKLLNSRFLRKDELITSGESLAFEGHLVDIGDPAGVHEPPMGLSGHKGEAKSGTVDQAWSMASSKWDALYIAQMLQTESRLLNVLHAGSPKHACFQNILDSNSCSFDVDNIKLSRRVAIKKPLRDANEILSILKKPMASGIDVLITETRGEDSHASESSDLVHMNLQDQSQGQSVQEVECMKQSAAEDFQNGCGTSNNEFGEENACRNQFCESQAVLSELFTQAVKGASTDNKEASFSAVLEESKAGPMSYAASTNGGAASFTELPQDSDALCLGVLKDRQPPRQATAWDGSIGTIATSSCAYAKDQIFKDVRSGDTLELSVDNVDTEDRCKEAASFATPLTRNRPSNEAKDVQDYRTMAKTDDCPTFDLGF